MNARSLAALSCAAVAVTALAPSSSAASRTALSWKATDCREVVINATVPLEVLSRALPEGYEPASNGLVPVQGYLYVGVAQCDVLEVGGRTLRDALVSDVGIPVEPVAGLGSVVYHLWQVVGDEQLRRRTAALGLAGGVVSEAVERLQAGPGRTATATVPWEGSDYEVVASGAEGGLGGDLSPGTGRWVHEGPRGRVVTDYAFGSGTAVAGPGTVRTSPGTALAEALGASVGASGRYAYLIEVTSITARVSLR